MVYDCKLSYKLYLLFLGMQYPIHEYYKIYKILPISKLFNFNLIMIFDLY